MVYTENVSDHFYELKQKNIRETITARFVILYMLF